MQKRILIYIVAFAILFSVLPLNNIAEASEQVAVSVNALNFRLGPGTQFWSMGLLSRGTDLTVLASENGWLLVRLADGTTGWVSGGFTSNPSAHGSISLEGTSSIKTTASSLNIRTGPGTKYLGFDQLASGTEAKVLTEENGWVLIRLPYGSTGWVSAAYTTHTKVENPSNNTVISTTGLNFRIGPGTQFWSMSVLPTGTRLSVLAAENGWFLVRLSDGTTGWVSGRYTSNPLADGRISLQGTKTVWVNTSGLNIRSGPGTSYLNFDALTAGTEARVLVEENGWFLVRLSYGSTGWISAAYTSGSAVQPPPETTGLQGKIICLDPGHGGSNPGAVGITGLWESKVNFNVAQKVAGYLRAQGATVILTRTGDYDVSLSGRVNIAHNNGAHIFVSIHSNSHPDPNIRGTETYYNTNYQGTASRRLATLIQEEMVSRSGLRNIGVLYGSYYVIRTPWIPSALTEIAFLSNYQDESLLRQEWFLDGQAQAISKAITRYFME